MLSQGNHHWRHLSRLKIQSSKSESAYVQGQELGLTSLGPAFTKTVTTQKHRLYPMQLNEHHKTHNEGSVEAMVIYVSLGVASSHIACYLRQAEIAREAMQQSQTYVKTGERNFLSTLLKRYIYMCKILALQVIPSCRLVPSQWWAVRVVCLSNDTRKRAADWKLTEKHMAMAWNKGFWNPGL